MEITNTQYIKKGDVTSVGIVKEIYDNASFKSDDGFCYFVNKQEIVLADKRISCIRLKTEVEQFPESIITTTVLVWHMKGKFCAAYAYGENITHMVDGREIEQQLLCFN